MSDAYREAGVDIEAGRRVVERMRGHVARTMRPEVLGGLGGFGAFFELDLERYQRPVLVSGTDGVGTKLKIAFATGRHDTIGQDCVAMVVNDIAVHGAEPLFFLDYLATGALDEDVAEAIVKGVADGCEQAGCALVGGETAEMPDLYGSGEYDLAGFGVGAVERDDVIDGSQVAPGDKILGLASTGVHSNGFSLVRKLLFADRSWTVDTTLAEAGFPDATEEGVTLGDLLLRPTRIYVNALQGLSRHGLRPSGVAHITGGGLPENLPRMIPEGLRAVVDGRAWPLPPVFAWLRDLGGLTEEDLLNTFNCGVGMAVIAPADRASEIAACLREHGEGVFEIGEVRAAHDAEGEAFELVGGLS